MNVRDAYITTNQVMSLAMDELRDDGDHGLSPGEKLDLWRDGFQSQAATLYDFETHGRDAYLDDYSRYVQTKRINGRWSLALDNKLLFHRLLEPFDEHRPELYGLVRDGQFHHLTGAAPEPATARFGRSDGGTDQVATRGVDGRNAGSVVLERLQREGNLVLKWTSGGGGNNVLLCQAMEEGVRVDGDPVSRQSFERRVDSLSDYLVTELVGMDDYAYTLYPDSPNTIRALTMYDQQAGEPFLATAVHRIGTDESAPVDNWSAGGLSAQLDPDTGQLSPAARAPKFGWDGRREVHPDTETQIAGVTVPGWADIHDELLTMADELSYIPYIAWDIVVSAPGEFAVIEANNYTDVDLLQVHEPLLTDERVRRFYETHGVC
ncbi:sugar-transfer associated ATP-grasp domain-containing protein [Haloarchaeobius sp. DYHT-AS-18]|uniref:sugar-transfer associated ATP-grasp domain-containing protein n=1 Tax=Haloarchaeobius sp. DYHT-AS-18 TaxID=3446117 RepID=UPI003EB90AD6